MQQHFYRVNGMKSEGCESIIESAVKALDGVEYVEADFESSMAIVKGTIASESVTTAIDAAGYNAILVAE